ncbi:MAG: MATE family efflux transporter [Oscillospiraceae bacterium]|nr:MATE family efflux transporter [Oscillospiraceae bacterium]
MKEQSMMRRILPIAIPISLQNLINVGVSVTDTLMIGGISEAQLSGVAQANQPYIIFTTLVFGLATGSTVLTAQYWGREECGPIRAILGLMLRIGMFCALAATVLLQLFPSQVLSIFSNDPGVIEYGVQYLRIVSLSYLFSSFTGIYLIGLRSTANVRVSMCIYGAAFVLNVFLNWVFIFGNLGAPRMECRGAALATLISRIFEFLLVAAYMRFAENRICLRFPDLFRKTSMYWRALVRYSLPVLFSELNWGVGIAVQAAVIGHLGVPALAASSLINVLQELGGVAVMGLGSAAGVLVGNLIGEGKDGEAIVSARKLTRLSYLFAAGAAAVMLLLRPFAPNLINGTAKTDAMVLGMMVVLAYLLFFQSINIVTLAGILRGAGDTVFCMSVDFTVLFLFKIFGGLFFTLVVPLHPVWVYFILSSDEFAKTLVLIPRILRGKWIYHTAV